jgi:hypothetical protein
LTQNFLLLRMTVIAHDKLSTYADIGDGRGPQAKHNRRQ